jgi:hypothetical protein
MKVQIGDILPNSVSRIGDGGCDVAPRKEVPVKEKTEDEKTAESLGITVTRLQAARKYASFLVQQARHRREKIKPSTVRAKVAKKFNIKLS